jgi:hypothetical protein
MVDAGKHCNNAWAKNHSHKNCSDHKTVHREILYSAGGFEALLTGQGFTPYTV